MNSYIITYSRAGDGFDRVYVIDSIDLRCGNSLVNEEFSGQGGTMQVKFAAEGFYVQLCSKFSIVALKEEMGHNGPFGASPPLSWFLAALQ